MRILFSCIPFDHGRSGISVYMRHTVAALARAGHDLTLVLEPEATTDPAFAGFKRIVAPGYVRRPVLSMLWHLFILPFKISRKKYDLFYIAAANRRAVSFRPVPTVAVVHDLAAHRMCDKYDRLRTFYQTKVLPYFTRRAEYPVAISKATASDMVEFLKLPEEEIIVSCNGLALPTVPPTGTWLKRHGLEAGGYILYISRLEHPAKNQYRLIGAYEMLPPELTSRYKLVLGGAGWNGGGIIRARAKSSPLADQILMPGFIPDEDMDEAYRGAALYVFPSLFEGFGLSLIEAMHYGIPCACSDCSSLGELGYGAALLFNPHDTASIAEAMKRILSEPELRAGLAEAGRKRAAEFTWEKHIDRILDAVNNAKK